MLKIYSVLNKWGNLLSHSLTQHQLSFLQYGQFQPLCDLIVFKMNNKEENNVYFDNSCLLIQHPI